VVPAITVTVAVVVAVVALVVHGAGGPATSAVSAGSAMVNFMGLTGIQPPHPAPAFALTDQAGAPVSLADLRGKSVVLEFMDPHCTDICPIISQEFVDAYKDLGANRSNVAFVAVDVNLYHQAVSDVAAFTDHQGLDRVPSWYFLTGSAAALRRTWADYGIYVDAPSPNVDVHHGDDMYFIDTRGRERAVALPTDQQRGQTTGYLPPGQIQQWGTDIAAEATAVLHS
jgi:cytochrome oxidase Cu insertion factor (SCO1/SenC/PrrC family)